MEFGEIIIDWYNNNKRDLPWRGIKDPYKIWLSEVILQQTRVEQGLPYYNKFIDAFPTIFDLAKASENKVLKLWQGLGYYSRARNMLITAKIIVKENNGVFPDSFEKLLQLKGIGTYTAAAIASFSFNIPVAVVDGNVFRLLSRYFGIDTPIDSTIGKKKFQALALKLLNKQNPGIFNQAIMEFGARQCKPSKPDCQNCPLILSCNAYKLKIIEKLPVKAKGLVVKKRYFNYLFIKYPIDEKGNYKFLLNKRIGKDIWKNLFELPLIEKDKQVNIKKLMQEKEWKRIIGKASLKILSVNENVIHKLSHQTIITAFYEIELKKGKVIPKGYISVNNKRYHNYGVPRLIENYLKKHIKET
jgi:A/G-specific adenine glycosylase